jgi:hypothetical protein
LASYVSYRSGHPKNAEICLPVASAETLFIHSDATENLLQPLTWFILLAGFQLGSFVHETYALKFLSNSHQAVASELRKIPEVTSFVINVDANLIFDLEKINKIENIN